MCHFYLLLTHLFPMHGVLKPLTSRLIPHCSSIYKHAQNMMVHDLWKGQNCQFANKCIDTCKTNILSTRLPTFPYARRALWTSVFQIPLRGRGDGGIPPSGEMGNFAGGFFIKSWESDEKWFWQFEPFSVL